MSSPASPSQDELYPQAFRLARLYAILSPRVLMEQLKVDRGRAERLLEELERHGAVGPTVIKGTGARESRVNIVEDRPAGPTLTLIGTDPRLGWRAIGLAAAAALGGLGLVLLLARLGVGAAIARWFRAELGSPTLAAVITNGVPLLGLGFAWLLEYPFRVEEDLVPARFLRVRQGIWTTATLAAIGWMTLRLLS
ncbi:MAG TPA: hypothetical protein VG370_11565 [Chloroflexota bacterium]|nr:hypothetical protein [Chloroflexota bacterium]